MKPVAKLVTEDSFDAVGKLVPAGQIGTFDAETLTGKEPHLHDVPSEPQPVVEISAIAPTGPNPTVPQQLPSDAVQLPGGGYGRTGAILTAERTAPAEERREGLTEPGDNAEGEYLAKLREAEAETGRLRAEIARLQSGAEQPSPKPEGNADDDLVAGNVAEIVAELGGKDDAELEALRAAEMDRERPRKGVLSAIKEEQAKRTSQS